MRQLRYTVFGRFFLHKTIEILLNQMKLLKIVTSLISLSLLLYLKYDIGYRRIQVEFLKVTIS